MAPETLRFLLLISGFVFVAVVLLGLLLFMRYTRRRIQSEMDITGRPLAAEGTPGFAVGIIQKLKEQEQELERLRRAERDRARASASLSEAVLSNLASGVLLFNPAALVQQANPAGRAILGYASPLGLHARELFRGVSALRRETGEASTGPTVLLEAVQAALREGRASRRLEADYTTPAGEERVLGITISPVRGAAGESLGATCLVSDLTEITALTRQVRLREQMAALGEMSAGIAHEFKNSLATISGYAQMLEQEASAGPQREFAGRIVAETATLARVVTEFLSLSRPQALRGEAIELRPLLEECAQECPLELRLEGVPADFVIHGDRTALRQVFSNLLRNSAQAARTGARVTVEAQAETEGQGTRVTLRDDGSGISAADLGKIFLPFYTTKAAGTGLGLALVHRLVSQHGGTIAASSEAGGAAFTLWLPAGKRAEKPAQSG